MLFTCPLYAMRTVASSLLVALTLTVAGYGLYALNASESSAPHTPPDAVQPVNAVLGNASYRALFGTPPQPDTPERLRLQTHLAYVEALLRSRPRPSLTPAQRNRRSTMLDALRDYWTEGAFPRNTEVPGRSPVFIDEQGRLCAVGHLLAVSAGRPLAKRIDARYHLADVRTMEMPVIDRWAQRHGFTRRELAMIQPAYDPRPPSDEESDTDVEIVALSTSVGTALLNGVLLQQESPSVLGGTVGLASGATSLSYGLNGGEYATASSVVGATALILGSWNLVSALRQSPADEENAVSVASSPASQGWSVVPTSITTVDGTTRPGVRATIQF